MWPGNRSSHKAQTSPKLEDLVGSQPDTSTPTLSLSNARRTTEAGSETSSFLRREAELQAVEERFRDSHLRIGPLVPIQSKFKEIFDHYGGPDTTNGTPFLFRLHSYVQAPHNSAAIENLDGNGTDHITFVQEPSLKPESRLHIGPGLEASKDEHLKVPILDHGHSRAKSSGTSFGSSKKSGESGRARGFSSSKDGDETAQIWKRALRAESKSRSPRDSTSCDLPLVTAHPGAVSESNEITTAPHPFSDDSLKLFTPGLQSPTCDRRRSRDDDATFRETLAKSSTVLQGWARQLERQELETRKRSPQDGSVSQAPIQATKIPPASWARFPSHNREQRNAAAGKADSVKSKDFAVKETSAAGDLQWTTDILQDDPTTLHATGRSFSDRLSLVIKTRWSKIITGRSGTPSRDRSMHGGRRSSIQTGGELEYPELELLPSAGRYRELRALEREIDELKGIKTKRRSSSDTFATQHDRIHLTDKMADAIQQHSAGSDAELSKTSDTASYIEEKASMVLLRSPDTPVTQIQYPNVAHTKDISGGSTVERYATPFSHLTSSEHGPSRAATPDLEADFRVPPTNHLPRSIRIGMSVVRRASLQSMKDPNLAVQQLGSGHAQDRSKRRSAPMLNSHSFV